MKKEKDEKTAHLLASLVLALMTAVLLTITPKGKCGATVRATF